MSRFDYLPTQGDSPAMQLYKLLFREYHAPHWSNERFNHTMREATALAVRAGLRFALDDFKHMLGDDGMYYVAIDHGNTSACVAIEYAAGRPPFIFNGTRLYVGAEIVWEGLRCLVTSFSETNNQIIVLGHYGTLRRASRSLPRSLNYLHFGEGRPTRLFRVTRDELKAEEKRRREQAGGGTGQ